MSNGIQNLIALPVWTPRVQFPPSQMLVEGRVVSVFSCGNGLYLMTNWNFGDNNPVWGVGWAESDHWALRVWGSPSGVGELKSPPAQWAQPSLTSVGRPADLSFASVLAFETAHSQRLPGVGLVSAVARITDGEIRYVKIQGYGKVAYCYEPPNPKPADLPTAIEFRLSEA